MSGSSGNGTQKVRLGVIGLGNMGSSHMAHSVPHAPRCEVAAVCDVRPERMEPYSSVRCFTDSRELIRSGLVDAVLIATPHYSHTTIGIDAMSEGLHVLVEKPISVHKADCEKLIAAHRKGLVFAAMFNLRTDPHFQTIRKLVQGGDLGEIRRVSWIVTNWFRTAAYYASSAWRATWAGEGGGVLLNQCPHNLDLYQWIFGLPETVWARCEFGKYHDIEVEDSVTAFFRHPNGATGVFVTTTGESPGSDRLEVAGDRGRLIYEGGQIRFDRTTVSVKEFCEESRELFTQAPTWKCEIPASGHGGQHAEVLRNFLDAVLDGSDLIAPAAEGIRSVELANAMILSSLTGGEVHLPLDGCVYEKALRKLVAESTREKVVREKVAGDMTTSFR